MRYQAWTVPLIAIALAGCAAGTSPPAASPPTPATAAVAPPPAPPPASGPSAPAAKAESGLTLYFDSGSAAIRTADDAQLDKAARLFREGNPFVMIVSGQTDTVGSPEYNLRLSQKRADAVAQGLIARGTPAARLQVLAKGSSEAETLPAGENQRRAEITWRKTAQGTP